MFGLATWQLVVLGIAVLAVVGRFVAPSLLAKATGSAAVSDPHAALDHLAAVQAYLASHGRGPAKETANAKCAELAHAIIDSGFIGGPAVEE